MLGTDGVQKPGSIRGFTLLWLRLGMLVSTSSRACRKAGRVPSWLKPTMRSQHSLSCSGHEKKAPSADCLALAPEAFLWTFLSVNFAEQLRVCLRLQAMSLQKAPVAGSGVGGAGAARAFMAQAVQQLLALEGNSRLRVCF